MLNRDNYKDMDKVIEVLKNTYKLELKLFRDCKNSCILKNEKIENSHNYEELSSIMLQSDHKYNYFYTGNSKCEEGIIVRWDNKVMISYDFTQYGPDMEIWLFENPKEQDINFIKDLTSI